jgi:hypothetical protein
MRTVFLGTAIALLLAAALAGCKENEETFYVEHMKSMPEPPDCEVSAGDPETYGITLDVATTPRFDFYNYFLLTNALVSRENYDNLVSESNGIVVDGSEVVVTLPGGGSAGASEYRSVEAYVPPETSDVVPGITIPESLFDSLEGAFGCQSAEDTAAQMTAAIFSGGEVTYPGPELFGAGYGTIQFVGHTQGDVEVQTPEFTYAVNFCCNCSIDWKPCADNPCNAFCVEGAHGSCALGINDAITCSYWMYGLNEQEGYGNSTWAEWHPIDLPDGGVGYESVQVNCDTCTPTAAE